MPRTAWRASPPEAVARRTARPTALASETVPATACHWIAGEPCGPSEELERANRGLLSQRALLRPDHDAPPPGVGQGERRQGEFAGEEQGLVELWDRTARPIRVEDRHGPRRRDGHRRQEVEPARLQGDHVPRPRGRLAGQGIEGVPCLRGERGPEHRLGGPHPGDGDHLRVVMDLLQGHEAHGLPAQDPLRQMLGRPVRSASSRPEDRPSEGDVQEVRVREPRGRPLLRRRRRGRRTPSRARAPRCRAGT